MSSLNQDRTANRVALCSAIFAGFAYVGYAVVRTAFGGRRREEINNGFFRNENDVLGLEYEGDQARARGQQRLYMRRLSGSSCPAPSSRRELAAADIRQVTQQLDSAEAGDRCVLRPLSVRERLREMNLNAMAFADTLLILHGKKPLGPRSLHSSPFHSPTRIMSPLDINRQFLMYDSPDNQDHDQDPPTPRLSRRSSRRNLSRRSLASSVVNLSEEQQGEAAAVAQTMLADREAELTRRLDGFESSRPRELTPYESRSLVALLHSRDRAKVARTLVTVSNCAAFTRNQDLLREAGLLVLLPSLLADPDRGVQLAAVRAASNLALNTGNMKEMEQVVLVMVLKAEEQARNPKDTEVFTQILLTLTNLAVLPDWHHHLHPLLPCLLENLLTPQSKDRASEDIRYQSSRLLVNLTCNDDNIRPLLRARCPPGATILALVARTAPEEQLLRNVTFLANLAAASVRLGLVDLRFNGENGEADGEDLLAHFNDLREAVVRESCWLAENHKNSDIRMQARKMKMALSLTQSV